IVDNVIDDIDPRLRSIMGCKKILFPCVERVLSYAEQICSRLPGPMEFSKETHSTNSTVRTLFANHRIMAEVFSQCPAVQEFFKKNPLADCAYLVLGSRMRETTGFGMEQHGELIIKDVLQTNVNFDDYRITHPSQDEATLRFNLRERALHECVAQTIKKLMATKTYNQKLEEDEVKLRMQLSMFKNQEQGLGPLMQDDDSLLQRIHNIKTKLKKVEHKHIKVLKDVGTLNGMLKKSASLLKHPAKLIDVTTVSFCVDHFNHIITDNEENDQHRVNLAQVTFSGNEKRVGILAIFPRKELITRKPKPVYL
ncbi:hypothetical protein KA005_50680, partial [bacterium]|nr:hypothetical protein [bacterium]